MLIQSSVSVQLAFSLLTHMELIVEQLPQYPKNAQLAGILTWLCILTLQKQHHGSQLHGNYVRDHGDVRAAESFDRSSRRQLHCHPGRR